MRSFYDFTVPELIAEAKQYSTRYILDNAATVGAMLDHLIPALEASESRCERYKEAWLRLANAAETQASITHPEADILTPVLDEFRSLLEPK